MITGMAPNEEIDLEAGNYLVIQEFPPDFVDYVKDAGRSMQQIYVTLKAEKKEMLLDHLDSDMDDLTRTFWEVHFQPEADDLAVLFDGVDLAKDAKKRGWQMSVNADLLEGVDLTLPSSRGEVTKKLQEGQPRILVACPPSRTSGDDGARLLDPVRQRVRFIKEQTAATLVQFAMQEAVAQVDRGGEIVFEQPSSSTTWAAPVMKPLLERREVQAAGGFRASGP